MAFENGLGINSQEYLSMLGTLAKKEAFPYLLEPETACGMSWSKVRAKQRGLRENLR